MKKIWLIGLSMLMMFGLLGCGSDTGKAEQKASAPAPQKVAETAAPAAKGKILVAYFSATGNTKQLAEGAAKALGADLYEVRPAKPYTSEDLNYNDESTRATVEQKNDQARPELADKNAPVANYDTIVLAYPIRWPIMIPSCWPIPSGGARHRASWTPLWKAMISPARI